MYWIFILINVVYPRFIKKKKFNDEKQVFSRKMLEHMDYHVAEPPKYSYITEFQSHEPEVCQKISTVV